VTTGTQSPFDTSTFHAWPLGHDCEHASPYTIYGSPRSRYCGPTTIRAGLPATGSGTVEAGVVTPFSVMLPQSALGVSVTGFLPRPDTESYPQSNTYATFVNAAGSFFVGGGPAAGLGQKSKTGMGQTAGRWIIREGPRAFGGAMGLLGAFGARAGYLVPGVAGTYEGTNSWDMIRALGRVPYATSTGFTPMGKTSNWLDPHDTTNTYINTYNGKQNTIYVRGSGTPWTTGSVTLYATAGIFTTILHRAGYDATTPGGARNIQLVTPALTHWVGSGFQDHTGHVGILKLTIAPEPSALLALAAGLGMLILLRRAARRAC